MGDHLFPSSNSGGSRNLPKIIVLCLDYYQVVSLIRGQCVLCTVLNFSRGQFSSTGDSLTVIRFSQLNSSVIKCHTLLINCSSLQYV